MIQSQTTAIRFEYLVRRILEVKGYEFLPSAAQQRDGGCDFLAKFSDDVWAIEVKFYRTARAQVTLLEAAASRLVIQGLHAEAARGMLVVSCVLPSALQKSLEQRFSLTFVDRAALTDWAADSPELIDELTAFLEVDPAAPRENFAEPRSLFASPGLPTQAVRAEDTRGRQLCNEVKLLKRGRASWAAYEKLCEQLLRYLFPNDLHGWHRQVRTDDGLNRFDYICRIQSRTEFWKFLVDHLSSRYVLFEFKNYTGQIKQGQILTTEKYLFSTGLRRVAIVFTRVGADKGAITMLQGAMREHGNLILILDDKQVCEMLHMKERGEDPADRLFELTDYFLMSLPR
ncbi:Restriction endonuclease [Nitrosospira sp. Nsp14]|uniref:restriction endonuclease n=1 Tax=Nitrosospira sp. Nsp14 TaxID=1855333 RepID=UPI0008E2E6D8|nr:restriction endonuclease [Nitrosospira sp. Nsp14]SFH58647.1 Restriction endonuclease [Nitrosospira sp. Nsp14]